MPFQLKMECVILSFYIFDTIFIFWYCAVALKRWLDYIRFIMQCRLIKLFWTHVFLFTFLKLDNVSPIISKSLTVTHTLFHIANSFWSSSRPHNHFSHGTSTAKNDSPEVAQNCIKGKDHTWAITSPNLGQLIALNWPWTRPKQVLLLVPILSLN